MYPEFLLSSNIRSSRTQILLPALPLVCFLTLGSWHCRSLCQISWRGSFETKRWLWNLNKSIRIWPAVFNHLLLPWYLSTNPLSTYRYLELACQVIRNNLQMYCHMTNVFILDSFKHLCQSFLLPSLYPSPFYWLPPCRSVVENGLVTDVSTCDRSCCQTSQTCHMNSSEPDTETKLSIKLEVLRPGQFHLKPISL